MADALDDAWAKLDRAGEHIKALQAEIRRFGESRPYSVTGDPDLGSGEYVLRIKPKEPPKRIGVLIGDVLSNLRPSLDYLIHALAILDSGSAHTSNQFPICDTPKAFTAELAKGRLAGISTDHVTLIQKLQPYPRRKAKVWLRLLREYSNPDKHRHLSVLLTHIEGDFTVPEPEPAFKFTAISSIGASHAAPAIDWSGGNTVVSSVQPVTLASLAAGTAVPSVSFPSQASPILVSSNYQAQETSTNRNVHVELSVSVGVAFPEGTPVVETLQVLESQVAQTLNAFEPLFDPD